MYDRHMGKNTEGFGRGADYEINSCGGSIAGTIDFVSSKQADALIADLLERLREQQGRLDAVSKIVNRPDWEGFPPVRVDADPIRAALTAAEGAE